MPKSVYRRLLRTAGLLAVVITVAAVALFLLAHTYPARDLVFRRVQDFLETGQRIRLEAGTFDYNLARGSVSLGNLRLSALDALDGQPFLEAQSVFVDVALADLLGGGLRVEDARLDGLALRIEIDAEGRSNLPGSTDSGGGDGEADAVPAVLIESLAIQNGSLVYVDQGQQVELRLPSYDARVRGNRLSGRHAVQLAISEPGSASFEGRAVSIPTLRAAGEADAGGVQIEDFSLNAGPLQVRASGSITDLADPALDITVAANARIAEAAALLGLEQEVAGGLTTEFTVSGKVDDLTVEGSLQAGDASYGGLRRISISSGATWRMAGQTLQIERLAVDSPVGQLQLAGNVATGESGGASKIDGSFSRVNLRALAREFGAAVQPASRAAGSLTAEWAGLDVAAATGSATVRLTPQQEAPSEAVLPLGGVILAERSGGRIRVRTRPLAAAGASIAADVTVADDGRLAGQIDGSAEEIRSLLDGVGALLGEEPESPLRASEVSGPLTLTASLSGSIEQPRVAASIASNSLTLGELAGGQASIELDYAPAQVTLRQAELRFGGQALAASGTVELGGESPALDLTANVRGVSIESLLAVAGQDAPVEGTLNLSAAVQGTPDQPQAAVDMDATDLSLYGEELGQLTARAEYADQTISLTALELQQATEASGGTLRGSGTYTLESGELAFQIDGEGLTADTLALEDGTTVRGQFDLHVRGEGALDQPRIEGTLAARELVVDGSALGDIDSTLGFADERAEVRARLPRFGAAIEAAVETAAPYSANATVTAEGTDLGVLELELGGQKLTGAISASLEASGALEEWRQGTATLRVTELQADLGEQSLRNEGDVVVGYGNQALQVTQSTLDLSGSKISASGSLPLEDTGAPGRLTFQAEVDVASLAGLAPAEAGISATGALSATGSVEGSLASITPQLRVEAAGGTFSGPALREPLTDIRGAVSLRDGGLYLEGLAAAWAGGTIAAEGQAPLGFLPVQELPFALAGGPQTAQLRVDLKDLALSGLTELPSDAAGALSIHADLEAASPELQAVSGQIRVDRMEVTYKSLTIAQDGPSTLTLANGRAAVDHLALRGPGTNVVAEGGVDLSGEGTIDLRVKATSDAKILNVAMESVSVAGPAELDLTVGGTLAEPEFAGGFHLRNGQAGMTSPQVGAVNLNLDVALTPGLITITNLSSTLNGGKLNGQGTVAYAGGEIGQIDLRVTADEVFVDFPEGLRTLSRANIRVASDGELVRAGGKVEILEGSYTSDLSIDRLLVDYVGSRVIPAFPEDPDPFLSRLRYGVDINTVEPLVIDNNVAELAADVDLRLVGTHYRPGLTGRVNLEEDGTLYVSENRYFIERGTIDFLNETRIEPVLDIVARTQAQGKYDIELSIAGGGAEDLSTTLTSSSHPELPEPDLISLLLTGRTRQELRGEEVNVAAEQSLSYLTGAVGSRLTRRAADTLGLSEVRIEPNLIAAESDPSARLTVGQNLTADARLVYSMNLTDSSDQIWIAEYNATRRLTTQATKQADNSYRFDLRHDIRFGGAEDTGRIKADKSHQREIGAIEFEGDAVESRKELLGKLKTKPGKTYDFFQLRRGVDRLGSYFAKQGYLEVAVRARNEERADLVDLTVQIERGPHVEFAFEGWDAPAGLRKRVRELWRDGVFDAQRLSQTKTLMLESLVEDGYYQAEVEPAVSLDGDNKRVVYDVARGVQFKDAAITFPGIAAFTEDDLRDQLEDADLLVSLHTAPEKVTTFVSQLLRSEGYLNAAVQPVRYDLEPSTGTGSISVAVIEGPRFQVGEFQFSGNKALTDESLRAAVVRPKNGVYTPAFLEDALVQIEEAYWRQGYNDVAVTFRPVKSEEQAAVSIETTIDEKRQEIVEDIQVQGTDATSDKLVLSQLGLKQGDTLDFDQVSKARRALYQTGAYSLVDIRSQPLDRQVMPGQQPVGMQVKVREVKPFQLRYGVFYDTERGPGLIADFANRNSLGKARVLGLRTRYDSDVREARAYFSQPLLKRFPLQTTGAVFVRRELQADFITDRTGVSVIQETRWGQKWLLSYGYRFEKAHTFLREPDPLFPFDVTLNVAPLNTTLTRETRDDILDATRGSFISSAIEYAPSLLGSDLRFIRYFGQFFKYIALGAPQPVPFRGNARRPRFVYASGVRVGLARGLGGQTLIPTERFFAGGGTTVRGFDEDTIGPPDVLGDPAGGNAVFLLNNELRFPLVSFFDGVGFVDLGNVYTSVSDFDPFSVRKSAGLGLRVRTPYFLLRADYGLKLDRRTGESRGGFFFSIGPAF